MKVACLWSGGKDSCFATYKAIQKGYNVAFLFNFLDDSAKKSLSHGLQAFTIQKQASSTEFPLFQKAMPRKTFREKFIKLINEWKKDSGIEGIVFGDIYLQEHKDWIDKLCEETKVDAIMPIWEANTKELIEEFIQAGFKAIVIATNANFLGQEWLGRKIDKDFINDMKNLGNIDLCGEKGEFHTFVYDGPIFKKPVEFIAGKKILKDKHWFLEIIPE